MSLLDTASLILTPNGYKASKLYSVKPTNGDGDMVVSRNTTATRVNSAGVIESVAINVPRLDYTGGGCPKILVEPLRTNLVFPSATLTTQTRTVTAVAHTLSFYGTGTIVLSGVHIATLTGTGANNRVTLTFTPTAGSLILTVAGTVTNAQLEAGSNATSYIPTVAGTVTRVADVISKTGVSSLIGQTEGTLYAEFNNTLMTYAGSGYLIRIFADANNEVWIRKEGSLNTYTARWRANSTNVYTQSTISVLNGNNKIAIAYKSGDSAVYLNGTQIGTSAGTGAFFVAPSQIAIGSSSTIEFFNDRIELATLFQTRLTNAQLATLTTL